jgi:hypothetical protein
MSNRSLSLVVTSAPQIRSVAAHLVLLCPLALTGCLATAPTDPDPDTDPEGEVATSSQALSSLPPSLTQFPIAMRASVNQQYVSALSAGAAALSAVAPAASTWERFQIYDLGGGNVAIKSLINNRYVTATQAGAGPLVAAATVVDSWEIFRWVPVGSSDFALQAAVNGRYVSALSGGWGSLTAAATAVGSWETFSWLPSAVLENQIAIRANVNQKYVSALYGGTGPLTAAANVAASWETFQVKDLGDGKVAIKALDDGLFVSALYGGAGPLTASGAAPASWETFNWVPLGGNNFALQSLTNNRYVTATSAGAGPLVASATVVDAWESFSWSVMPSTLAQKFAPQLRFQHAASSFPMPAQRYFEDVVSTGAEGSCGNQEEQTSLLTAAPTYYQMTRCGSQTRITYWWFYGLQHSCSGDLPAAACTNGDWNGYHNGDWERVMVTLSEDASQVAAVTYFQHEGSYTRLAARSGFELEQTTHPVVYVGQVDHGSFHNPGGSGGCGYWEDYRDFFDASRHLDGWDHLVSLDITQEPWMTADHAGGFSWGYNGVNHHPTTDGPSCSLPACMGASSWSDLTTDGCYRSQCEDGDDDSGSGCVAQCRGGYSQYPLTCTNWSTWYTYNRQLYGYDYPLPTSDVGLLSSNPY